MWIHFWFNFFLKLVNIDLLPLLFYTAFVYFLFVLVLLAANKEVMMKKPKITVDVDKMHPASKL